MPSTCNGEKQVKRPQISTKPVVLIRKKERELTPKEKLIEEVSLEKEKEPGYSKRVYLDAKGDVQILKFYDGRPMRDKACIQLWKDTDGRPQYCHYCHSNTKMPQLLHDKDGDMRCPDCNHACIYQPVCKSLKCVKKRNVSRRR